MSLSELLLAIPETNKDALVGILELLDLFGLVSTMTCRKAPSQLQYDDKSSKSSGESSSSSSSSSSPSSPPPKSSKAGTGSPLSSTSLAQRHTSNVYYSIAAFARGSLEFSQFTSMKAALVAKRDKIRKLHSRVQSLDELTSGTLPHTRTERLQNFRKLLDDMAGSVQDDPLYRSLLEQPSLSAPGRR
jgi:hypothetical protein